MNSISKTTDCFSAGAQLIIILVGHCEFEPLRSDGNHGIGNIAVGYGMFGKPIFLTPLEILESMSSSRANFKRSVRYW
jgi:hypothetical protein